MRTVGFNIPPYSDDETRYIAEVIASHKICGDGEYTFKCNRWMEDRFKADRVMLTTSGTAALDMAALLCDIKRGDEVILPSYTFSSTANAFVLCGAKLVFIDIRPDTMNIDETKIEEAITDKTVAIVPVHYGGVACEMDYIMDIARRNQIKVVEDAAQAVMSTYKGRYLGTIADFGCYSFHETKNFSMGEGGAISINDSIYIERAEILREKGTDRSRFHRGQIDKYTWVDYGDSFLPSELNAAYLYPQLLHADEMTGHRLACWKQYYERLNVLKNRIELPYIPKDCEHNAHMFWIKVKDITERTELIEYLKKHGVAAVFHYIPLHSSPGGKKYGRFHGEDLYTTSESERLLRLPMHCELSFDDVNYVCDVISEFFENSR